MRVMNPDTFTEEVIDFDLSDSSTDNADLNPGEEEHRNDVLVHPACENPGEWNELNPNERAAQEDRFRKGSILYSKIKLLVYSESKVQFS